MEQITLIDVTSENWFDICLMHPGKEGECFVADNSFSIAESVYEGDWTIKAIALDGKPIGFTMYGYTTEEGIDGYEICRFMVDEEYQGRGYGKRALRVIIDEMIRVFHCPAIYLSTNPENARGIHVYTGAGFVPTGTFCGEGDDREAVFKLPIA